MQPPDTQSRGQSPSDADTSVRLPFLTLPVICSALIIGGLALLVLIIILRPSNYHDANVCTAVPCQEFANLINASLNLSQDPCNSFQRFTCDGWRHSHHHSVRRVILNRALDRMASQLWSTSIAPPTSGQTASQKAFLFYRSCDAVRRGESDEVPAIKKILQQANVSWPRRYNRPDVLRTLVSLALNFDLGVLIDFTPNTSNLMIVKASSLTRTMNQQKRFNNDEKYERDTFNLLKEKFGDGDEEGVSFEEIRSLDIKTFERLALKYNISIVCCNPVTTEVLPGPFDPVRLKEVLLEFNATNNGSLVTNCLDYLVEINKIWAEVDEADMHLFISWLVVRYTASFANLELMYNYYGTTDKEIVLFEHGKWCCLLVYKYMGDLLFVPFTKHAFSPKIREDVVELVDTIRHQFAISHTNLSSPLSSPTATWDTGDHILRALDYKGPPDGPNSSAAFIPDMNSSLVRNWRACKVASRQRNWRVEQRTFDEKSLERFEFYTFTDGGFQLAPYVLTYPLYNINYPRALKYGALGSQVARAYAELSLLYYNTTPEMTDVKQLLETCLEESTLETEPIDLVLSEVAALNVLSAAFQSPGRFTAPRKLEVHAGTAVFYNLVLHEMQGQP
ncbi:hypothetical protein HPB48_001747 [Haemaphysalis longicornis]|uniref:Peptidase M13 N-terminal domain-containing protein n=1 Tax=Haemaphysalis longicornis TaxID=44386 RepID=A0A9J6GEJ6_HAELO|nr:hypothetical protein HPB48_001747 [Haemaphysalis longicornis]